MASTNMTSTTKEKDTAMELSAQQLHALHELLIHHHTYYGECIRFNKPSGINDYGPPFDSPSHALSSKSPILQTLLYRFVLPLPGVRSFSPTFWTNIRTLLKKLAAANLSDSYDHAGLGLRRTLATGSAALLEYPGRGVFEGLVQRNDVKSKREKEYDLEDPDDLKEAWEVVLHESVHGDMVDVLFDRAGETDKLSDHSSLVQAAHEFILLHLASVIHYIFVESPDAVYVQKLTSNILKLLPWTMIRQSLRYGNAATMINAMTKLFLTKLSLTSFTNWMGWSNNPDDGMNLLQQIVSTLLGWDIAEYQKKLAKIRKSEHAPSTEHLEKLDAYHSLEGAETERLRSLSQKSEKSIVTIIFEDANLSTLKGETHTLAIEYLALCASMHDREVLSKIICHSSPDLITASIREAVTAYDPIFRAVHNAVDLSATCIDLENFLADFMALFEKTPRRNGISTPRATDDEQLRKKAVSVDELAAVLRKHQGALHRFLHSFVKKGGDIATDYRTYTKSAVSQFRTSSNAMSPHLSSLFTALSPAEQTSTIQTLDLYSGYLSALTSVTTDRLQGALFSNHSSANDSAGPGAFLARWQQLLDASPTTPTTPKGKVRYGSSRLADGEEDENVSRKDQWKWPDMPDVGNVVEAMGESYAVLLGELGREHWRENLDDEEDVD